MVIKLKKFAFGRNKICGFSLIEVLVVISIVSIVSLIALPNLKCFVQQQQLNHAARVWLTKIRIARLRAIKFQKTESLTWQNSATITLRFQSSFGRNQQLTFQPNGFTQGQQGSFYICLRNQSDECRQIIILASGVVRQVLGEPG